MTFLILFISDPKDLNSDTKHRFYCRVLYAQLSNNDIFFQSCSDGRITFFKTVVLHNNKIAFVRKLLLKQWHAVNMLDPNFRYLFLRFTFCVIQSAFSREDFLADTNLVRFRIKKFRSVTCL